MAKRKIIELLSQYIDILKGYNINIEDAFLYGSYSRKDQTSTSDIDVLLVIEDLNRSADDLLVGKIWRLTKEFDERIEPLIISKERFQKDDVSPVLISIKRESIPII